MWEGAQEAHVPAGEQPEFAALPVLLSRDRKRTTSGYVHPSFCSNKILLFPEHFAFSVIEFVLIIHAEMSQNPNLKTACNW